MDTEEIRREFDQLRVDSEKMTLDLQRIVGVTEREDPCKRLLEQILQRSVSGCSRTEQQLKLCEDVVETYKKTLELFEKYPKDLLWSAVERELNDRQTELEKLWKELSEVASPDEDSSSQDCDMKEVEEELKLCEQFRSDLLDLVSGSPEEVSECVQETQCQYPQEGRQQLLEEVDGEPSQQCHEEVKPGEVQEEVSCHSGGLDEFCKVDEAFQLPQNRIINGMEMVKKGLAELSKYFEQLGRLAKNLAQQGSRVKHLQERCAKWLALLLGKDRELERVREENRKLKMLIATTQSQEETPIQRSLSKSSVMRGGDLIEYIDSAITDVCDVEKKFDQEMNNACSPPKGEQEFGNPQDGSRGLLVPGNSGPGTLRRIPSCFGRQDEKTPEEDFMERFEDSFPNSVDAKAIATKLFNKYIIPDTLKNRIDKELSDQDASLNLYHHLKKQSTFCGLTTVTIVMKGMIGYQRMIEIGNRMKKCLVEVGEFCECKKHGIK